MDEDNLVSAVKIGEEVGVGIGEGGGGGGRAEVGREVEVGARGLERSGE